MTPLYLMRLVHGYREALSNVESARHNPTSKAGEFGKQLSHVAFMLEEIPTFIEQGKLEKAHRWLGFIQGTLWVLRIYTIDELKEHNSREEIHTHNHDVSTERESKGTVQKA